MGLLFCHLSVERLCVTVKPSFNGVGIVFFPCGLGVIIIAGLSVLLKSVVVLFDNSHLKTQTSRSDPLKMFEASLQNPSVHPREENCI